MKIESALMLSSLLASPVALAIQPVSISAPVPAINSAYGAGTAHTVVYTITNRVPKIVPITLSGISGSVTRTPVANDCGDTLPRARGGMPATCNLGVQIMPTDAEIGSTINQTLLIDYQEGQPLTASISFMARQAYLYVESGATVSQCSIDLETGVIGTCVPFTDPSFNVPVDITINPAGTYAYISNVSSNTISVCSIQDSGLLGSCTSSSDLALIGPAGSSINPAGTFYYVANFGANSVAICPINSDASLALCRDQHTDTLSGALDLVINAQNTFAYITNPSTNRVFRCSILANGNFGPCNQTGPVFSAPRAITMNPAQTNVYVSNASSNALSVCPVVAGGALGSCVSSNPGGTFNFAAGKSVINSAGTFFFASNLNAGTVSVCPLDSQGALVSCAVGAFGFSQPEGLALV